MIKNAYVLGGCLLMTAISLSSCGTQGTVVRADNYDAETIVDLMNEEEPLINSANKKKQPTSSHKQVASHTPLDGEWIIINVGRKSISRDTDMPYVIFSDKESKFYASNGCNIINGTFEYKNGKTLTFNDVVATKKMCPDVNFQLDISSVLNDGVTVKTKIENKNRETYLYLYSNSNDLLLTLRRHNLETINGQWEVSDIEGEEVDGSEINLFFDIAERSVHGNTGCNYFNGKIIIDPEESSSISFTQMGVTMRYCDNADIERMLLVALEETEGYNLTNNNTLQLLNSKGKPLITLYRAQ